MNIIAGALTSIGSIFANLGSQACAWWWLDEPETPKSLIK